MYTGKIIVITNFKIIIMHNKSCHYFFNKNVFTLRKIKIIITQETGRR